MATVFNAAERISIHALREESDVKIIYCISRDSNFNPRPPRGERHLAAWS